MEKVVLFTVTAVTTSNSRTRIVPTAVVDLMILTFNSYLSAYVSHSFETFCNYLNNKIYRQEIF
jgi:hypothetical protein